MLNKLFPRLLCSLLLVFGLSATSQAAMFDFVAEADKPNGERAVMQGFEFTSDDPTFSVKLRSSMLDESANTSLPYFDSSGTMGPAGLGVCSQNNPTAGSECPEPSDDNITLNEVLTLDFEQLVKITNLTFNNGEHAKVFTSGAYLIDQAPTEANFNSSGMLFNPASAPMLTGNVFHFISNSSFDQLAPPKFTPDGAAATAAQRQLYLGAATASPVPVPSAFILFGTGLAALVGWNYRKAKK